MVASLPNGRLPPERAVASLGGRPGRHGCADSASSPYSGWVAALVWAGACLVSGVMVGFLFGIPRTLQSEQAGSKADTEGRGRHAQQGYAQRVNTNLEQISDWADEDPGRFGADATRERAGQARGSRRLCRLGNAGPTGRHRVRRRHDRLFLNRRVHRRLLFTRLFLARLFWAADVWGFERRFARIEGKVEETKGEVNMNHLTSHRSQDLARTDVPRSTLEEDIRGLEALRKDFGAHRTLHIVLGRLYDRFGPVRRFHRGAQLFPGGEGPPRPRRRQGLSGRLFNRAATTR